MMMEEVAVPRAPVNGNGRNESGKEMIQMKFIHLSDLHLSLIHIWQLLGGSGDQDSGDKAV